MSAEVSVKLVQVADYRFAIHYQDGAPPLPGDEPPPLGQSQGATPSQFLAAAVGSCLSDSLLFALRKFKQNPDPIQSIARCVISRNAENRLRISDIFVDIQIGVQGSTIDNLDRVLAQFQDFCTVSSSVSLGIPVHVSVKDKDGTQLYPLTS